MFQVAVDVGGTFTDFVVRDDDGRIRTWKVPSSRTALLGGIAGGLAELAGICELNLPAFLSQTTKFIHGTTFGINGLLEQQGARTALITTAGLRDALEMRRSQLKNQWNLFDPIAPVIVPRRLRFGLRERVNFKGEVLVPLDFQQLEEIGREIRAAGVQAVAVALLFSFQYPEHERAVARWLQETLPEVFVSISAEVAPQIGNFERTSTTVINAFLAPSLIAYMQQLRAFLAENGYQRPIYLIQNNGGLTELSANTAYGVKGLLSGPAGGARGARTLAETMNIPHMVSADMGGTSFDVSLIRDGQNELAATAEVAGYPIALPMLDIRSIGVGGGSIASVDDSGMLRVGPRSAGAVPGPACYDMGGNAPTITDASLVLGLLNADRFLAGRQRLSVDRASDAIARAVATPLGVTVTDAAYAIYQVAAAMMADAVYLLTVRRGYDPREFTLALYGGASPLFAGPIAEALGVRTVVIPHHSSVFSARGMLDANLHTDFLRSVLRRFDELDGEELARFIDELKARGHQELSRMGVRAEDQHFAVSCDIRYTDQHHEVSVPLPIERVGPDAPTALLAAFHELHEHLYGYSEPEGDAVLVNIRVAATEVPRPPSPPAPQRLSLGPGPVPREMRPARWEEGDGFVPIAIYDGDNLLPGDLVHGPAIIERAFTTAVVPSKVQACLDRAYNIILQRMGTEGP